MRDRLKAVTTEAWGWTLVVVAVLAWTAWHQGLTDSMRYALCLACMGCDAMWVVSMLQKPRRRDRVIGWGIAAVVANGSLGYLLYPNLLLLPALALPSLLPAVVMLAMARSRR